MIAFLLKGYTSRMILEALGVRAEFPKVTYLRSLWTSSYFVSTVGASVVGNARSLTTEDSIDNVSSETERRYIEGYNTR
jgi:hypothetical protein